GDEAENAEPVADPRLAADLVEAQPEMVLAGQHEHVAAAARAERGDRPDEIRQVASLRELADEEDERMVAEPEPLPHVPRLFGRDVAKALVHPERDRAHPPGLEPVHALEIAP